MQTNRYDRDPQTGALFFRDRQKVLEIKNQSDQGKQIQNLDSRLNKVEDSLSDIKEMLTQLLNKR
jgi:hypothetical protein